MEAFVISDIEALQRLPASLRTTLFRARRAVAFTGAGISAESGVPTFRGKEGLWTKFKPEELASITGFLANPDLVWEWYQHRRRVIEEVQPNPAHYALVEMEMLFPDFVVITQNVDRLHHRAGSTHVIELHGNLEENYCLHCGEPYTEPIDLSQKQVPHCPHCGGLIRPAVVWFGEMLPEAAFAAAEQAARNADLLLSIGTSGEVFPAAQIPVLARTHGAVVIEVNPEPTMISSYAHLILRLPASKALPALVALLKAGRQMDHSKGLE